MPQQIKGISYAQTRVPQVPVVLPGSGRPGTGIDSSNILRYNYDETGKYKPDRLSDMWKQGK